MASQSPLPAVACGGMPLAKDITSDDEMLLDAVAATQSQRYSEAAVLYKAHLARLVAAKASPLQIADAEAALGHGLKDLGDLKRAKKHLKRALAAQREHGPVEDLDLGNRTTSALATSLSQIYSKLAAAGQLRGGAGKRVLHCFSRAGEFMQEAMDRAHAANGAEHLATRFATVQYAEWREHFKNLSLVNGASALFLCSVPSRSVANSQLFCPSRPFVPGAPSLKFKSQSDLAAHGRRAAKIQADMDDIMRAIDAAPQHQGRSRAWPILQIRKCAFPACGKEHATAETFKRCGACKGVVYCGLACSRSDWKRHKPTCAKAAPTK
jgi:tetratricopeptide (TPR) repeat protein